MVICAPEKTALQPAGSDGIRRWRVYSVAKNYMHKRQKPMHVYENEALRSQRDRATSNIIWTFF